MSFLNKFSNILTPLCRVFFRWPRNVRSRNKSGCFKHPPFLSLKPVYIIWTLGRFKIVYDDNNTCNHHFNVFFFLVRRHLFDHLLWSIFQSSFYTYYTLQIMLDLLCWQLHMHCTLDASSLGIWVLLMMHHFNVINFYA